MNQTVDYHLRCIARALEDAQSFIRGETPEVDTYEEAARGTLNLVRAALLKHLPEVRNALS